MGGESGRNTVVDAGSGKGYFSERLAACGYRVTAIDSSPFAIAAAESVTTGGVRYLCGDLSIAASLGSFDAVVCVDVLFHIMDDTHWAVALDGLASVVRPGGVLVYSDAAVSEPSNLGGYIRHRPTRAYAERLSQLGFRQTGFEAFGVGRSDIGFYRFERR
jgi:2-polyprenyl-3-methyl-5-hydroxy-6-metoxy-1,4-benzoquinol methylase